MFFQDSSLVGCEVEVDANPDTVCFVGRVVGIKEGGVLTVIDQDETAWDVDMEYVSLCRDH